jgi:hypothetical protein
VVSDIVFSLIAASYRRVSLRETRLRRAAGFFTVFLLRCGKSHCRLRASLVSFAQIIDEPGKTIRARARFGILFLHLVGPAVHIPATSKWIDDAFQD